MRKVADKIQADGGLYILKTVMEKKAWGESRIVYLINNKGGKGEWKKHTCKWNWSTFTISL